MALLALQGLLEAKVSLVLLESREKWVTMERRDLLGLQVKSNSCD